MAMNMVFSSADLANAGDSSSQLKTDGHREGHGGIALIDASARRRGKLLVAREVRRDDSPVIRVVVGPPAPNAV
jgi:hypothetical protein